MGYSYIDLLFGIIFIKVDLNEIYFLEEFYICIYLYCRMGLSNILVVRKYLIYLKFVIFDYLEFLE